MDRMRNRRKRKLASMEISELCLQLETMAVAGIPLVRALNILKDGSDNRKLCAMYGELERELNRGVSLSGAMDNSGMFPELAVNMVRAGEAGGNLKGVLAELAKHYQKEHRMGRRLKGALLYPKIVGLTAILTILVMFLFVMPSIEPLFAGMELPAVTRFLMAFSRFLTEKWYLAAAVLAVMAACMEILKRSERFCCFRDHVLICTPFIGRQLRIIYTARFARCISSLYSGGLPMVESLRIAGRVLGNRYLETRFPLVIQKVQNGEMLSEAIKAADGFEKKLSAVIFVGEETGKLDVMLEKAADGYEYETDVAMTKIVSMAEPVIILILGAVVGISMLGIMLPLWHMYEYI